MKHFVAVAAMALAAGCISIQDSGGGTRALTSKSPTDWGTAIFTKEIGPQDSAVIFQVADPKASQKPVTIGFVGDENWKGEPPKNAVWSKDGSVIAVQGANYKSWSHVYDFKKHDFSASELSPLPRRAAVIEKLLESRGGIGPRVLDDWSQFDAIAQNVAQKER